MDENVLVVPVAQLDGHLRSSFDPASAEAVIQLANSGRKFLPRSIAEEDETHKQIIPYVCIRRGDSFLLLQRTSKQSEKRLHNKFSLGIGGHINDTEMRGAGQDLVKAGMLRELQEEISVGEGWRLKVLGVIYDPATPVGRVHLGISYLLEPLTSDFRLNEPDLMSAQWVPSPQLPEYRERMEGWSQILLDQFISPEKLTAAGAA